jgi:hypothetical protein
MKTRIAAAMLASAAGSAFAQPVVDGQKGSDNYGNILWAQNQPTSFGNNVAGPGGTLGDPQNVTKGAEFAIPMSLLGNPTGAIKLAGFVNGQGHDYLSNQVIGGLPTNTGNLAEPRAVNFNARADNQWVNLGPSLVSTAPVMDGTKDAIYGGPKFVQNNYTGFGNASNGSPTSANGSELDAVYAVVYDNGTPGNPADDVLYVFVAGNLETNFNKLDLFFDTGVAGQNRLAGNNAGVDFNGLNRMGDDGSGNGLTFDSNFQADYWLSMTNGGAPTGVYVNFAQVLPGGGGPGFYCGTTTPVSNGVLTGGDAGAPPILATIDNSNTAGVGGSPSGISIPNIDVANGSEIDGLYGVISNGRLYLLITGNLETNFNKLDLFFDVNSHDGQNQLGWNGAPFANCDIDYNGLNRMSAGGNGAAGAGQGLKFDTGFFADYWVGITNGSFPVENYVNSAVLRADGPLYSSGYILDYSATDGGVKSAHNPVNYPATFADQQDFSTTNPLHTNAGPRLTQQHPTQLIPGLIVAAINNNNVGGVSGIDGTISTVDAANVTTGVELSIDLSELGWDGTSAVKVAGFLNGIGHDFVSNQVIGGLPTPIGQQFAPSLGETTLIDFSAVDGNQFVVVPPPTDVCCRSDYDGDGDTGTDFDIQAFFACLGGNCCATCPGDADFNCDGDAGTDADIESFFRVLAGGNC